MAVKQRIKDMVAEQGRLREKQRQLTQQKQYLYSDIQKQVGLLLNKESYLLEIGGHTCPPEKLFKKDPWFDEHFPPERLEEIREANPLGLCVYEPEKDPCRDECLFCGMPEERK